MNQRDLICICCPLGCPMTVTLENGQVAHVQGNSCKRGELYGQKECTHPTRTVTSSVRVTGGVLPLVSVKTAQDIPKEKIWACMEELKTIRVPAPVKLGDIVCKNIAGTNVDLIATKSIPSQ